MTFGKWLYLARTAARLTQDQLAERAGISPNYVSALERDEPNARDGSPRRPRVDKVDKLARALSVDSDEARLAAGYAPISANLRPTNPIELITALDRLGIPGFEHIEPFNLDPQEYEKLLEDIRLVVELRMNRNK